MTPLFVLFLRITVVFCAIKAVQMVNIVILTDEPVAQRGLVAILGLERTMNLTEVCHHRLEVLDFFARARADIFLCDFTQDLNLTIFREVAALAPQCRSILWTREISVEFAYQAMAAGIHGILKKTVTEQMFLKCLQTVSSGEIWLDRSLTMTLLTTRPIKLAKREGQLIGLLAQGLKNKEIATALNVSEGTVKVYLSRLFEKVGAKDRFELALYGLKNMTNILPKTTQAEVTVHPQDLSTLLFRSA